MRAQCHSLVRGVSLGMLAPRPEIAQWPGESVLTLSEIAIPGFSLQKDGYLGCQRNLGPYSPALSESKLAGLQIGDRTRVEGES